MHCRLLAGCSLLLLPACSLLFGPSEAHDAGVPSVDALIEVDAQEADARETVQICFDFEATFDDTQAPDGFHPISDVTQDNFRIEFPLESANNSQWNWYRQGYYYALSDAIAFGSPGDGPKFIYFQKPVKLLSLTAVQGGHRPELTLTFVSDTDRSRSVTYSTTGSRREDLTFDNWDGVSAFSVHSTAGFEFFLDNICIETEVD